MTAAMVLPTLPFAAVAEEAPSAAVAPAVWSTDIDAAKAQAAKEGKAILMDFTGSDWCRYCIILRQEVLDQPEFAAFAKDKFVLMEVDVPKKAIPAELSIQNTKLCKEYQVNNFPTVLIVSPEGDVLGGFCGGATSLEDIRETLEIAYANLAKLQTARKTTGVERAKLISDIYTSLTDDLKPKAAAYRKEIADNDPDDTCGLSSDTKAAGQMAAFRKELRATGDDYAMALFLVEGQLRQAYPQNISELLLLKSQAMTYSAETTEDILRAKEVLLQAIAKQKDRRLAKHLMDNFVPRYDDPEALLKKVKATRPHNK